MHPKTFVAAAALALGASAQENMNLTALLGSESSLSALVSLLQAYPDLASVIASQQDVTLFAPNNAAIQQLTQSGALNSITEDQISEILLYHVIPSVVYASNISETPAFVNTALVNATYTNVTNGQVVGAAVDDDNVLIESGLKMEAQVVKADLNYTNGVVHIIDQVLTIPLNVSTTAIAAGLSAFAGAAIATDLLSTLDVAPDITIFAPSNDAFEAIGSAAGTLTPAQLTSILEYHVINGTIAYSSSLGNGSVETLGGGSVNITVADGAVFVNAARVINADILISGGVLHVIDSVLNPNGTAQPDPNSDTPVVQYSGASSAALGPLTSAIPTPSSTISALVATTDDVAEGYTTQTGGAVGTGAGGTGAPTGTSGGGGGGSASSSSSGIAALPTGMVGAAALFGGAALVANW